MILDIWVVIGGFRAFWSLCSHRSRALKTWFFHPKSGLTPQKLFLCIISARSFTRVVRMPRGTSGDCYRSQNSHFCNFWCILSYFELFWAPQNFYHFFSKFVFSKPSQIFELRSNFPINPDIISISTLMGMELTRWGRSRKKLESPFPESSNF